MFCPNCGSKNSKSQKFCRSCGLSLEEIVQSLVEQFPASPDESMERRRGRVERLGAVASCLFAVLGLGFSLYQIVFKMILAGGAVVPGIVLLALLICGILAVVFYNYAGSLKEAATKGRLQRLREVGEGGASTALLPEPHLEAIPSVTERTTELLHAEKRRDGEPS